VAEAVVVAVALLAAGSMINEGMALAVWLLDAPMDIGCITGE